MFSKTTVAMMLSFGLISVSYGGVRYIVTDIGKLRMYNDSGYSCATSINNNGQVVGYSNTNLTPDFSGPTVTHAFIWTKEKGIVNLTPNDTTGAFYRANDINDSGAIVGTVEFSGVIKPFIWSSSNPSITMIDIGTGIVSPYELTKINNHGYIILNVAFPNQQEKGYIWNDTKGLVELPSLPDLFQVSPHTRAYALNDSDPPRVVGYSVFRLSTGSANKRAVQWDFNNQDNMYHPYDIDSITDQNGTGFSVASAISENDIIGTLVYSWDTPGYYSFIYNPSIGFEFLPTLGGMNALLIDINNKKQVVGTSETGQPYSNHAFVWSRQNGIIDLHPFIVHNPKFQGPDDQSYVSSINDYGQIVGCANQRAFLLDPIFDLNITKDGSGSGIVTSVDGGINCGTTCSASYVVGTAVNLAATPNDGSTFTGWSGGGCSGTDTCQVKIDANKSVTANFLLDPIVFSFYGFNSPVDNPPIVNNAKAGSVIPVKWRIADYDGTSISDPASFNSLESFGVGCESFSGYPNDAVEEQSAGASGLQYLGDGNWQFNWKTSKSYAKQCRIMVLKLSDGSSHTAKFKFK